jgi:hypothetical protein
VELHAVYHITLFYLFFLLLLRVLRIIKIDGFFFSILFLSVFYFFLPLGMQDKTLAEKSGSRGRGERESWKS